jgi:hypothetical protein
LNTHTALGVAISAWRRKAHHNWAGDISRASVDVSGRSRQLNIRNIDLEAYFILFRKDPDMRMASPIRITRSRHFSGSGQDLYPERQEAPEQLSRLTILAVGVGLRIGVWFNFRRLLYLPTIEG